MTSLREQIIAAIDGRKTDYRSQCLSPVSEPTHGDILEKLGQLKGQVDTLIGLVGQKREDINALYGRVSLLEKTTASRTEISDVEKRITSIEKDIAKEIGKWAGICLSGSLLMGLLTLGLSVFMPRIHQGLGVVDHQADPQLERPQQPNR